MAKKKRKKPRKKRSASLSTLSPEELQQKGSAHLNNEQYQDAIRCFKQLLKQGDSPEIDHQLYQAYRGRINALAASSMAEEALTMLKTVMQRWPEVPVALEELTLLLKSGKFVEAAQRYREFPDPLTPEQQSRFDALFAALLLTASEGLQCSDFAPDSPVARWYPIAKQAVEALFAGRTEEALQQLNQLPLRSPWRDLRTLLHGMLLMQEAPEKSRRFLLKLDSTSPYHRLAARLLGNDMPPAMLLEQLAVGDREERRQLLLPCNLEPAAAKALTALADAPLPGEILKIITRYKSCFDAATWLQLQSSCIVHCGREAFYILGRRTLHPQKKLRLASLAAEQSNSMYEAAEFWDEYLLRCKADESSTPLETALVMRRRAGLLGMYPGEEKAVLEILLDSLTFAPHHAPTWLKAAELAHACGETAQYHTILRNAVVALPEDIDILIAAMKSSGERNAHKKAAGLAERILKKDPINTAALDFQLKSHLEHGRKLALQKKWALAEKELQVADTRIKTVHLQGRRQIALGMVHLLQKQEKEGLALIAAGREQNSSPLIGSLVVLVEAFLFQLPKTRQNQAIKGLRSLAAAEPPDSRTIRAILAWSTAAEKREKLMLNVSLQNLKKYFNAALLIPWELEEGLTLCAFFYDLQLPVQLKKLTQQLSRRFRLSLPLEAWHCIARCLNPPGQLPESFSYTVEGVLEELAEIEDNASWHLYDLLESAFDSLLEKQTHLARRSYGTLPEGLPATPQSPSEKHLPAGRQLNFFDDLLNETIKNRSDDGEPF